MTPDQFFFWLRGFVELGGGGPPSADVWMNIQHVVLNDVKPTKGGCGCSGSKDPLSLLRDSMKKAE